MIGDVGGVDVFLLFFDWYDVVVGDC